MSILGLGTVQFGCPYGISNTKGQVPSDEVEKILDFARQNGIDTIDTANVYGNSEEVLGHFDLNNFKIVTKILTKTSKCTAEESAQHFKEDFFCSLQRLKCQEVYGLMFHNPEDLLLERGEHLWREACKLKRKGWVCKLGISVYQVEVLRKILSLYNIDIVQFPLNILDQRFLPFMEEMKSNDIEIHVRSVFLQGLLLLEEENIPAYFNEIKPLLRMIPAPRLNHALQFVKNIKNIDKLIIGTTCREELQEVITALSSHVENIDYQRYQVSDEKFILPQNWSFKCL